MTTSTVTKIKNGTIILPKSWQGVSILIQKTDDAILIKKTQPGFWATWKKTKGISKNISRKDINKAIKWARKSK